MIFFVTKMVQTATEKHSVDRVVLDAPEHQNLLSLLVMKLLSKNLADDNIYHRVRNLTADIELCVGKMATTLSFKKGFLTIYLGHSKSPKARVSGEMSALLNVVSSGKIVGPVLSGAIKIGGNPFTLLKLLPLMKNPNTTLVSQEADGENTNNE